MSGLLNLIPSLHLPVEESTPSDNWLLLWATLPAAALTIGLGFFAPFWLRAVLLIAIALTWRYARWFRRPEGILLNVLAGWWAAEIFNLVVRR
jgi:hypothetical protein